MVNSAISMTYKFMAKWPTSRFIIHKRSEELKRKEQKRGEQKRSVDCIMMAMMMKIMIM